MEPSCGNLFNRCLGGFTQNANESFNSTIWALTPKSSSSGNIILQIAAHIDTCIFNDGISSILRVMEALELAVGTESYDFAPERDEQRVKPLLSEDRYRGDIEGD